MALLTKFDYGTTESQGTGRTGTTTQFPKQFVQDYHDAFGGPFTINDLFNMTPRAHSLFGFGDTGQQRPGGGFNLGFGAPSPQSALQFGGTPPGTPQGGTVGNLATDTPGVGEGMFRGRPYTNTDTPTTSPGPRHTLSELTAAYQNDPDKLMDLQRFFQQAHLNPGDFTLRQYQIELGRAKQYGFSGRSLASLTDAFSDLQGNEQNAATFGSGGKGTGVF